MRTILAAVLLFSGCAPTLWVSRVILPEENLIGVRRVAVVDLRTAPRFAERAWKTMSSVAQAKGTLELVRADGRGLYVPDTAVGQRIDVSVLQSTAPADAWLAVEVKDLRRSGLEVMDSATKRKGVQTFGEALLGVRLVRADGEVVVSRDISGRFYGPHPFQGSQFMHSDMPELALDDALQKLIESLSNNTTASTESETVELEAGPALDEANRRATSGEQQAAVALLEKVVALNPNDAAAMFNIGLICESRGNPELAQTWYRRAAAAAPDRTRYRDAERKVAAKIALRGHIQ